MDVPSQVPTSFVPHAPLRPTAPARPTHFDVGGAFSLIAIGALVLAMLASVGVFAYERVLEGQLASARASLATAEQSLDPATVSSFLRLRDQLGSIRSLLDGHITLSRFFDTLETTTVEGVSFNTLKMTMQSDKSAVMSAGGVARNFNALAAESHAIGESGSVTRVAFSNLSVNKDGSVNFTLDAVVAPELVENFRAVAASGGSVTAMPAVSAASTTPTSPVPDMSNPAARTKPTP